MSKVIIIGSGVGGLVAGNLLVRKGHKVTLFESHSSPGGYTAGFTRKGYYFESGTLSFEASASVFKAMSDLGILDKVRFVKFKTRLVSEEFDSIPASYDEFKQMLYRAFGSEKERLDRYFNEVDKMYEASKFSLGKPIPYLLDGLPLALSLVSYMAGGVKYSKVSRQYADETIREFTSQFFDRQSKLFGLLTNMAYPNMAADLLGMTMVMVFDDYWTVYDGMQSWANVLAENFKSLGGELRLNSRVDRILTKDGIAVGVWCRDERFDADAIIAACDYKETILQLLDDKSLISPQQATRIEAADVSEGMFTVYLGLKLDHDALEKRMKVPHVSLWSGRPIADAVDTENEDFFRSSSIHLCSPSVMNPNLAPEQRSSLMIQTTCPHNWMGDWGGGDKGRYRQLKAKVRDTLIGKAEAIIPGLRNLIELEDAATPLTYERYTHNTHGASSAWSWNPHKKLYDKTMSVNIDTPVKNLYIGSCWAMQMGGVPGALIAAYMCSKKIR